MSRHRDSHHRDRPHREHPHWERPDRGRRRRRGPIKRVVRGLADAFGVSRGLVIAGFVLGFVFAPLLTLVVFLVALYWVDHPERTHRYAGVAYGHLRRAADRIRRGVAGGPRGGEAGGESREPPRPFVDPAALGRRFEALERRARAIEAFVASEEFRLDREFRRMGRE